jgi:hypothetical protein
MFCITHKITQTEEYSAKMEGRHQVGVATFPFLRQYSVTLIINFCLPQVNHPVLKHYIRNYTQKGWQLDIPGSYTCYSSGSTCLLTGLYKRYANCSC